CDDDRIGVMPLKPCPHVIASLRPPQSLTNAGTHYHKAQTSKFLLKTGTRGVIFCRMSLFRMSILVRAEVKTPCLRTGDTSTQGQPMPLTASNLRWRQNSVSAMKSSAAGGKT